jgi:hypothetical protein
MLSRLSSIHDPFFPGSSSSIGSSRPVASSSIMLVGSVPAFQGAEMAKLSEGRIKRMEKT